MSGMTNDTSMKHLSSNTDSPSLDISDRFFFEVYMRTFACWIGHCKCALMTPKISATRPRGYQANTSVAANWCNDFVGKRATKVRDQLVCLFVRLSLDIIGFVTLKNDCELVKPVGKKRYKLNTSRYKFCSIASVHHLSNKYWLETSGTSTFCNYEANIARTVRSNRRWGTYTPTSP